MAGTSSAMDTMTAASTLPPTIEKNHCCLVLYLLCCCYQLKDSWFTRGKVTNWSPQLLESQSNIFYWIVCVGSSRVNPLTIDFCSHEWRENGEWRNGTQLKFGPSCMMPRVDKAQAPLQHLHHWWNTCLGQYPWSKMKASEMTLPTR